MKIFSHSQTWIFYSYRAYRVRKCYEVIDWNYHLHLPPATNPPKNQKNRCSAESNIIKADKGYEFITPVIANILHARLHDVDIVTRNISLNASDPQLLAPIHCSHTTTSHCRIVQVGESVQFTCTVKKLWTRKRWSLEKPSHMEDWVVIFWDA